MSSFFDGWLAVVNRHCPKLAASDRLCCFHEQTFLSDSLPQPECNNPEMRRQTPWTAVSFVVAVCPWRKTSRHEGDCTPPTQDIYSHFACHRCWVFSGFVQCYQFCNVEVCFEQRIPKRGQHHLQLAKLRLHDMLKHGHMHNCAWKQVLYQFGQHEPRLKNRHD